VGVLGISRGFQLAAGLFVLVFHSCDYHLDQHCLQVVHVSDTVGVWGDGGVTESGGMYVWCCGGACLHWCVVAWAETQSSRGLVSLWCGAPCVLWLVCRCRCATSGYAFEPQHAVLKDACQCAQQALVTMWNVTVCCCFLPLMGCPPKPSLHSVLQSKEGSVNQGLHHTM
jgi:hypothetical protein